MYLLFGRCEKLNFCSSDLIQRKALQNNFFLFFNNESWRFSIFIITEGNNNTEIKEQTSILIHDCDALKFSFILYL